MTSLVWFREIRLADRCTVGGKGASLGELESGMRRNLLRTLALDAFATSLER